MWLFHVPTLYFCTVLLRFTQRMKATVMVPWMHHHANAAVMAEWRHSSVGEIWCCRSCTWSVVYFFQEQWKCSQTGGGGGVGKILKQLSWIGLPWRGGKDAQADVNVGKMSNWILWCFHLQRLRKQRDTWTVRICLASACRFALALCSPLWGSLKFKRPKTVNNAVKPSVAVSTPLNANSANAGVIKVWLDWKKRKERGTKVYTNMLFFTTTRVSVSSLRVTGNISRYI